MDAIYKKCVAVTAHPESEVDVLPPTALVEALRSFASTDPAKLEACLCPRESADFNASSHFVALDDLGFHLDDVKLYTPSASRAGDAHVGIAPAGVLRSPCAKESVDYTAPNRSKHERPRDASPDAKEFVDCTAPDRFEHEKPRDAWNDVCIKTRARRFCDSFPHDKQLLDDLDYKSMPRTAQAVAATRMLGMRVEGKGDGVQLFSIGARTDDTGADEAETMCRFAVQALAQQSRAKCQSEKLKALAGSLAGAFVGDRSPSDPTSLSKEVAVTLSKLIKARRRNKIAASAQEPHCLLWTITPGSDKNTVVALSFDGLPVPVKLQVLPTHTSTSDHGQRPSVVPPLLIKAAAFALVFHGCSTSDGVQFVKKVAEGAVTAFPDDWKAPIDLWETHFHADKCLRSACVDLAYALKALHEQTGRAANVAVSTRSGLGTLTVDGLAAVVEWVCEATNLLWALLYGTCVTGMSRFAQLIHIQMCIAPHPGYDKVVLSRALLLTAQRMTWVNAFTDQLDGKASPVTREQLFETFERLVDEFGCCDKIPTSPDDLEHGVMLLRLALAGTYALVDPRADAEYVNLCAKAVEHAWWALAIMRGIWSRTDLSLGPQIGPVEVYEAKLHWSVAMGYLASVAEALRQSSSREAASPSTLRGPAAAFVWMGPHPSLQRGVLHKRHDDVWRSASERIEHATKRVLHTFGCKPALIPTAGAPTYRLARALGPISDDFVATAAQIIQSAMLRGLVSKDEAEAWMRQGVCPNAIASGLARYLASDLYHDLHDTERMDAALLAAVAVACVGRPGVYGSASERLVDEFFALYDTTEALAGYFWAFCARRTQRQRLFGAQCIAGIRSMLDLVNAARDSTRARVANASITPPYWSKGPSSTEDTWRVSPLGSVRDPGATHASQREFDVPRDAIAAITSDDVVVCSNQIGRHTDWTVVGDGDETAAAMDCAAAVARDTALPALQRASEHHSHAAAWSNTPWRGFCVFADIWDATEPAPAKTGLRGTHVVDSMWSCASTSGCANVCEALAPAGARAIEVDTMSRVTRCNYQRACAASASAQRADKRTHELRQLWTVLAQVATRYNGSPIFDKRRFEPNELTLACCELLKACVIDPQPPHAQDAQDAAATLRRAFRNARCCVAARMYHPIEWAQRSEAERTAHSARALTSGVELVGARRGPPDGGARDERDERRATLARRAARAAPAARATLRVLHEQDQADAHFQRDISERVLAFMPAVAKFMMDAATAVAKTLALRARDPPRPGRDGGPAHVRPGQFDEDRLGKVRFPKWTTSSKMLVAHYSTVPKLDEISQRCAWVDGRGFAYHVAGPDVSVAEAQIDNSAEEPVDGIDKNGIDCVAYVLRVLRNRDDDQCIGRPTGEEQVILWEGALLLLKMVFSRHLESANGKRCPIILYGKEQRPDTERRDRIQACISARATGEPDRVHLYMTDELDSDVLLPCFIAPPVRQAVRLGRRHGRETSKYRLLPSPKRVARAYLVGLLKRVPTGLPLVCDARSIAPPNGSQDASPFTKFASACEDVLAYISQFPHDQIRVVDRSFEADFDGRCDAIIACHNLALERGETPVVHCGRPERLPVSSLSRIIPPRTNVANPVCVPHEDETDPYGYGDPGMQEWCVRSDALKPSARDELTHAWSLAAMVDSLDADVQSEYARRRDVYVRATALAERGITGPYGRPRRVQGEGEVAAVLDPSPKSASESYGYCRPWMATSHALAVQHSNGSDVQAVLNVASAAACVRLNNNVPRMQTVFDDRRPLMACARVARRDRSDSFTMATHAFLLTCPMSIFRLDELFANGLRNLNSKECVALFGANLPADLLARLANKTPSFIMLFITCWAAAFAYDDGALSVDALGKQAQAAGTAAILSSIQCGVGAFDPNAMAVAGQVLASSEGGPLYNDWLQPVAMSYLHVQVMDNLAAVSAIERREVRNRQLRNRQVARIIGSVATSLGGGKAAAAASVVGYGFDSLALIRRLLFSAEQDGVGQDHFYAIATDAVFDTIVARITQGTKYQHVQLFLSTATWVMHANWLKADSIGWYTSTNPTSMPLQKVYLHAYRLFDPYGHLMTLDWAQSFEQRDIEPVLGHFLRPLGVTASWPRGVPGFGSVIPTLPMSPTKTEWNATEVEQNIRLLSDIQPRNDIVQRYTTQYARGVLRLCNRVVETLEQHALKLDPRSVQTGERDGNFSMIAYFPFMHRLYSERDAAANAADRLGDLKLWQNEYFGNPELDATNWNALPQMSEWFSVGTDKPKEGADLNEIYRLDDNSFSIFEAVLGSPTLKDKYEGIKVKVDNRLASGLKWHKRSGTPPVGSSRLYDGGLRSALNQKSESDESTRTVFFSKAEWDQLNITTLSTRTVVTTGSNVYYQPDDLGNDRDHFSIPLADGKRVYFRRFRVFPNCTDDYADAQVCLERLRAIEALFENVNDLSNNVCKHGGPQPSQPPSPSPPPPSPSWMPFWPVSRLLPLTMGALSDSEGSSSSTGPANMYEDLELESRQEVAAAVLNAVSVAVARTIPRQSGPFALRRVKGEVIRDLFLRCAQSTDLRVRSNLADVLGVLMRQWMTEDQLEKEIKDFAREMIGFDEDLHSELTNRRSEGAASDEAMAKLSITGLSPSGILSILLCLKQPDCLLTHQKRELDGNSHDVLVAIMGNGQRLVKLDELVDRFMTVAKDHVLSENPYVATAMGSRTIGDLVRQIQIQMENMPRSDAEGLPVQTARFLTEANVDMVLNSCFFEVVSYMIAATYMRFDLLTIFVKESAWLLLQQIALVPLITRLAQGTPPSASDGIIVSQDRFIDEGLAAALQPVPTARNLIGYVKSQVRMYVFSADGTGGHREHESAWYKPYLDYFRNLSGVRAIVAVLFQMTRAYESQLLAALVDAGTRLQGLQPLTGHACDGSGVSGSVLGSSKCLELRLQAKPTLAREYVRVGASKDVPSHLIQVRVIQWYFSPFAKGIPRPGYLYHGDRPHRENVGWINVVDVSTVFKERFVEKVESEPDKPHAAFDDVRAFVDLPQRRRKNRHKDARTGELIPFALNVECTWKVSKPFNATDDIFEEGIKSPWHVFKHGMYVYQIVPASPEAVWGAVSREVRNLNASDLVAKFVRASARLHADGRAFVPIEGINNEELPNLVVVDGFWWSKGGRRVRTHRANESYLTSSSWLGWETSAVSVGERQARSEEFETKRAAQTRTRLQCAMAITTAELARVRALALNPKDIGEEEVHEAVVETSKAKRFAQACEHHGSDVFLFGATAALNVLDRSTESDRTGMLLTMATTEYPLTLFNKDTGSLVLHRHAAKALSAACGDGHPTACTHYFVQGKEERDTTTITESLMRALHGGSNTFNARAPCARSAQCIEDYDTDQRRHLYNVERDGELKRMEHARADMFALVSTGYVNLWTASIAVRVADGFMTGSPARHPYDLRAARDLGRLVVVGDLIGTLIMDEWPQVTRDKKATHDNVLEESYYEGCTRVSVATADDDLAERRRRYAKSVCECLRDMRQRAGDTSIQGMPASMQAYARFAVVPIYREPQPRKPDHDNDNGLVTKLIQATCNVFDALERILARANNDGNDDAAGARHIALLEQAVAGAEADEDEAEAVAGAEADEDEAEADDKAGDEAGDGYHEMTMALTPANYECLYVLCMRSEHSLFVPYESLVDAHRLDKEDGDLTKGRERANVPVPPALPPPP
jgi:hypothetical protein